jgi:hypothetical protein
MNIALLLHPYQNLPESILVAFVHCILHSVFTDLPTLYIHLYIMIPTTLVMLIAVASAQTLPSPPSKGSVTYTAPKSITGVFDGGLKTYGRGVKCSGQSEGGQKDTVFVLQPGATLQNALIGADQKEGVYCLGACTIKNVWWLKVCEGTCALPRTVNSYTKLK